jgi:hypothetical protein
MALVFAQIAVAASACLAAGSARVEAIAAATHEGCEMQERSLNLCLYHCADQYNNNAGSPQLPDAAPVQVALPAAAWNSPMAVRAEAWTTLARATGPPIPIRHCCFRI